MCVWVWVCVAEGCGWGDDGPAAAPSPSIPGWQRVLGFSWGFVAWRLARPPKPAVSSRETACNARGPSTQIPHRNSEVYSISICELPGALSGVWAGIRLGSIP